MKNREILSKQLQVLKTIQNEMELDDGYLLEFTLNVDEKEGTLTGNSAGMLHFVCRILDMLTKKEGAHIHFDENSDFPEGSDKLTIICDR